MDTRHPVQTALTLLRVGETDSCRYSDVAGRKVGPIRSIPVDRILAVAWNSVSLEDCRRQFAKGTKPPHIQVFGMRRKGHAELYALGNEGGNHRTIAAREAGKKTIRAEFIGWYDCDPTRFILWRGDLWDTVSDHPHHRKANPRPMDPTTVAALVELGVRVVPDDKSPFEACDADSVR